MFERYSELSRRALFVARATACAAGASSIALEHLLMGAFEAWPDAGGRRAETARILGLTVPSELRDAKVQELPLSDEVQILLTRAMQQADRQNQHLIRPEHLLLALHDLTAPSRILRRIGADRDELVRSAALAALTDDSPTHYRAELRVEVRRD